MMQQQQQLSQISSQPAVESTPATTPNKPQANPGFNETSQGGGQEVADPRSQNTELEGESRQEVSISNVQVEAHVSVGKNPRKESWSTRKYVMQPFASTMHIRIAYFVNNQITKRENQDPLEYFKKYRTVTPQ